MVNRNDFDIHIEYVGYGVAGTEWSKTKFPYPHHRIYYITDGGATLYLNDSTHFLEPGNIYLVPAFSMVETVCEDHLSHFFCHFYLYHNDVIDLFNLYTPAVQLKASNNTKEQYELLLKHYRYDTPYDNMISYGAFYKLLAPFFQNCSEPDSTLLRFEPVLNYIENSLDTEICNDDLAKMMELNTVYFTHLFSKTFGLPPNQYIIKKRLETAQRLLKLTDHKIKEIAYEVGFEDHMYFSRLFKKKLKITPLAYRKNSR